MTDREVREWLMRRHPEWRRSTVLAWSSRQAWAVYMKERQQQAREVLRTPNGVYKGPRPGQVVQGTLF